MIRIEKLNKTYDRGRNANRVLRDVSFTLPETGFVCVLGPSGCGKTSLLNAIGGLDRFDNGSLTAGDTTVSRYGTAAYEAERNRSFGYIFQNYYLLMDHSAAYNVYLGLHSLELSHKEKLQRVRQALAAVEMGRYFHRRVADLSGGQQQRVAIARALARKPRVIFADEPTGNLDEANTLNICTLLRRISKTSLVIMVTHEQRIANFFADRIITLEQGRVASDTDSWQRDALAADGGKTLYAGEYEQTALEAEGVQLRLLTQPGAEPLKLTVLALTDRIVIKTEDPRAITCGAPGETPVLREGKRPMLTLQEVEHTQDALLQPQPQRQTKAGKGITLPMQLKEAAHLFRGRGLRRLGTRLFLVLLSVLVIFTLSDYLTVASIDPEDFITADSHVLEVNIEQGSVLYPESRGLLPMVSAFYDYLRESGQDFAFVPRVSSEPTYSVMLYRQMDTITLKLSNFSYVPLDKLDDTTLIYGRMPQDSREIVVDRWVLEKAAATDGIIQNSITDASYFLNRTLTYNHKNYSPTIVGICDSGQPAVYMDPVGMLCLGVNGVEVTLLSELQRLYPGEYDGVTLEADQCLVVSNNAGMIYEQRIGGTYSASTRRSFTIVDAIQADVAGSIVVDDSQLEPLLWDMVNQRFYLYCADKAQMRDFLAQKDSEVEKAGYGIVRVTDRYTETYRVYEAATAQKADARTIVTYTVMVICLAMLYLLQRAQVHERVGMLAVYRLLGIPGGKLLGIFAVESLLASAVTVLPGVALSWGYIQVASGIPELESQMLLPWQAALAVFGGIVVYYVLISLLPACRLLRLPPAQLAAKYDI